MPLSDQQIRGLAQKHGVTEAAVRDIAGLPEPEAVTVETAIDEENPGKVHFTVGGYDGDEAILDIGGSGFITKEVVDGAFSVVFPTPGFHRVRVDLGGTVRWFDVQTGVNTDPAHDLPVEEVPLPVGAPDFSQTLLGADAEPVENVPAHEGDAQAGEPATPAYDGLTKAELVALLEARDLPTSGNKPDLLARLLEADAQA